MTKNKEIKTISRQCQRHNTPLRISNSGNIYCYECRKDYVERNRATVLEKAAAIRATTRDKNIAYQREYRSKNREDLLEKKKIKYRKTHDLKPVSKYGKITEHPEYVIWRKMLNRCMNENDGNYKDYGGRGLTVCLRWRESFDNFIDDMGPRPEPREEYSIERINNNKGYYKENCRWATKIEQANNRRTRIDSSLIQTEIDIFLKSSNPVMDPPVRKISQKSGIPFKVCKYRYRQCPVESWVVSEIIEERNYTYQGHRYNIQELAILGETTYRKIADQLMAGHTDIEKLIEEQLSKKQK